MKKLSEENGRIGIFKCFIQPWHYFFIEGVESYHPIKWSVSIAGRNVPGGAAGRFIWPIVTSRVYMIN